MLLSWLLILLTIGVALLQIVSTYSIVGCWIVASSCLQNIGNAPFVLEVMANIGLIYFGMVMWIVTGYDGFCFI
jgi:hypothetical protein